MMLSTGKANDGKYGRMSPKRLPGSLVIITSDAASLANFRGQLIMDLVARDVKVYALAPDHTEKTRNDMRSIGAIPMNFSLNRTAINPIRDIIDTWRLSRILKRIQPDETLSYFIKPVIYGTIAAWISGVPRRYALIEGLGYLFTDDGEVQSLSRKLFRVLAAKLYQFALARVERVILLNPDDLVDLKKLNVINENKAVIIPGIGVDLSHFHATPKVFTPPTFSLIARMLREKGIYTFVEAARIVKKTHPDARFLLVGGTDVNPGSVQEEELRAWDADGAVEWVGKVHDVREYISLSSVFVLPSFREGFPRSTQEAMAMGRPIITTSVPGCRETVIHQENGFVIPVRDPIALADAMMRFIDAPELITTMGAASRRMAESKFDVHKINRRFIEILSTVC